MNELYKHNQNNRKKKINVRKSDNRKKWKNYDIVTSSGPVLDKDR